MKTGQEIRVCKANILIWREMHAITHFLPESLEMGKQLAKGACVWHVKEKSPLSTQMLAWDGKGLVNMKKRVPVPGERPWHQEYRRMCEERITQIKWGGRRLLGNRDKESLPSNSLAFFLQVNLDLISFQDFSGCFPRQGDKGTHLRSKPDVEFDGHLSACFVIGAVIDSAARELGGGEWGSWWILLPKAWCWNVRLKYD